MTRVLRSLLAWLTRPFRRTRYWLTEWEPVAICPSEPPGHWMAILRHDDDHHSAFIVIAWAIVDEARVDYALDGSVLRRRRVSRRVVGLVPTSDGIVAAEQLPRFHIYASYGWIEANAALRALEREEAN